MKMEIHDADTKYGARFSLYLPVQLHAALHEAARQRMTSTNALLREMIVERLRVEHRKQKAA